MASEKKIEFLVQQGFAREIINTLIECGVDKSLMWFLGVHKRNLIPSPINLEEIRLINTYFEKSAKANLSENEKESDAKSFTGEKKVKVKTPANPYLETLALARKFDINEKRKQKNKLYTFENGYYISLLNDIDLSEEGRLMSNCVGGYQSRVASGDVGILALKNSSGRTYAHIEIYKNGLIGQNYTKANCSLSKEHWMMIFEFFDKHSKNVDLNNIFGDYYLTTNNGGHISNISLAIPTAVQQVIGKDGIETEHINGFEVKRFYAFHNKTHNNSEKITVQKDVIDWIEERKQEVIKAYDDLTIQIMATTAGKLFLSDEIKEKIFGHKKGAYFMKGKKYSLSELKPSSSNELVDMPADEVGMEMAEPGEGMPDIAPAVQMVEDEEFLEEFEEAIDVMDDNDDTGEIEVVADEEPREERRGAAVLIGRVRGHADNGEIGGQRPELDIQEVQHEGGYEAYAEDQQGNVYGIHNMADIQEADAEEPLPNVREGEVAPPEPFDELMRRARR